ncbi:Uncharacterised protein [Mycobacteroides abscessus subsp. abscessus]|nr:Uncharacterised protein [Mycobacteroides abscessus subsp. abscessus]
MALVKRHLLNLLAMTEDPRTQVRQEVIHPHLQWSSAPHLGGPCRGRQGGLHMPVCSNGDSADDAGHVLAVLLLTGIQASLQRQCSK